MAPMVKKGKAAVAHNEDDGVMRTLIRKKRKAFDILAEIFSFLFSNVGLLFLCICYAYFGALLWISLELPGEELAYIEKQNVARDLNDTANFLADVFWGLMWHKNPERRFTKEKFLERAESDVNLYIEKILEALDKNNYDGQVEGWEYDWTIPKTLVFTISVMTTIGYGNITPKTFFGKLLTIPYTMIGMPLLFVFLGNIGAVMAELLKLGYSRLCCRWCRARRLVSERPPGQSSRKAKKLIHDIVGEEEYMPTSEIEIPVVLLLVIVLCLLLTGSFLYHYLEDWDLMDAAYFSFITVTTIGFGDMVPDKSFQDFEVSFMGKVIMCISVSYIMFGLAFLSMDISLIQENIMLKADRLKRTMGLNNSKRIRIDKVSVRERLYRDNNGVFVGLSGPDSVSIVETIETESMMRDDTYRICLD
ncbi:TWiK family of potassium channels protein 7 [Eurytemora carolleeae]|uniref:TWiK family of potassium channels protein 7 n=1 Tax=Eurytemora carolleeae TaxID=1294199 RepID=UPI000C7947C3|nr:TWiK family of potassium channels protein 7 [Eurytemora carolleeae]|eukprot:XP_023347171.1 TWiK family of potassium channels protein 7-like [Eurytemora affinis]